jgi:GNAT superfamily N-acetyltransferase
MLADQLDYVVGVDPHRDLHALAVVDVRSGSSGSPGCSRLTCKRLFASHRHSPPTHGTFANARPSKVSRDSVLRPLRPDVGGDDRTDPPFALSIIRPRSLRRSCSGLPDRSRSERMIAALRPIEVRTAAADAVPKVAAALADAFDNDPVFTFLLSGRLRQEARLRTMFAVEIELYVLPNGGTVWTTSAYDGAVAELPPGAWEMPKSATGKETLKWMWAFRTRLPRAIKVQRAMEKRHLREPHFYVRTVGVRTALQGQGVGSMLMQPILKRADSAGLPTYIEASTERSAGLYEQLGFRHTGAFELPDGGPPVWPMLRPAAGADVGREG